MKIDSQNGSLESARISDPRFFNLNNLRSIVDFTGLQLKSDVCEVALLRELNSLIHSCVTSQYKTPTTSAELREALGALQKYDELSRRLSNSEYPPLRLNQVWFRQARTRLFQLETEFALTSQRGPKVKNMLISSFLPQALGLYSATFDREPVSTTPSLEDEIQSAIQSGETEEKIAQMRARGSTVKFIRKVLGLVYDEINHRNPGPLPTSLDIFNPSMKTDRTISDWILKALNYKSRVEDAFTSESGYLFNHSDWRQAKDTYLYAIRLKPEKESG